MKQHSIVAIVGLIFAILAICCFFIITTYVIILTLIFAILAIIFGATSYWGRWKDKLGLADFIIGVVVVVIWFLAWVIIYTFVSGMLYGVPSYKPKVG
jgi:hypothetical protein